MLIGGGATTLAVVGGAGILEYLHATSANNRTAKQSAPITRPTATPAPGPRKLIKGVPVLSLTGHTRSVDVLAWDPSGRYLATGSEDTHIMLWDITSALPKNATGMQSVATPLRDWRIPVTDSTTFSLTPNALSWSGDGHTIAVVTNEDRIYLFNTTSSAETPDIYQDSSQSNSIDSFFYVCVALSPKANMFAASASSIVHSQLQAPIWRVSNKAGPIQHFSYQDANTTNVVASIGVVGWSVDGTALAGLTNYGLVIVWDARTGAIQQILHLPDRPLPKDNGGNINNQCMAWSPANPHLLVASDIDIATVWDTEQNKLLLTLQLNEPVFKQDNLSYYVWGLSWSPNGKYIAICYPKDPKSTFGMYKQRGRARR